MEKIELIKSVFNVIWVVPISNDPDEKVFYESVYSTHFDLISAISSLRDFRLRNLQIPIDMSYILEFDRC